MNLESLLFFAPATILMGCGLYRLFRVLTYRYKCTEKISATVTDFKYIEYIKFSYFKSPIYKYTYNDVEYNVKSKMCYLDENDDKRKGHLVYIMVNPNKPSQIYDCTHQYIIDTIIYFAFALATLYAGIIVLHKND